MLETKKTPRRNDTLENLLLALSVARSFNPLKMSRPAANDLRRAIRKLNRKIRQLQRTQKEASHQ